MSQLTDHFGREFEYLRLSITDECNFKCNYCLPEGYRKTGDKLFLTLPEIKNLLYAFAELGIKKVRITGGEPTLRKDFSAIILTAAMTPGIEKVALTTNGFLLNKQAENYFTAGLGAINISVDSLDAKTFHLITGRNIFQRVMQGVSASLQAGINVVKINTVLMKGFNDQDLAVYLDWIKDQPLQLRFIELMQTQDNGDFFNKHHLSGVVLKEYLLNNGWVQKVALPYDGPAQVFTRTDYQGEIGLIMPYSKDFCKSCNRLRVSSTGRLHLCLFTDEGIDLRELLSSAQDKEALKQRIIAALATKKAGHYLYQGKVGKSLMLIGG